VRDPGLDLWWFALPVLVGLGLLAAWRAGPGAGRPGAARPGEGADAGRRPFASVARPAVCGLVLAAQYLFMIDWAGGFTASPAPRFSG
jgi:hypothetical protein